MGGAGGVAGGAGAGGDGSAAAAPLLSISGKDTLGSAGGGAEVLAVELLLGSVRLLWARAPEESEGLPELSEESEGESCVSLEHGASETEVVLPKLAVRRRMGLALMRIQVLRLLACC